VRDVILTACCTGFFFMLFWWGVRTGTMPLSGGAVSRSKHPTMYKMAGALLIAWVAICATGTAIAVSRLF
jgi:hypothetical protein